MIEIKFFQTENFVSLRCWLTHYLTTFASLDVKWSIIQLKFYSTTTNSSVRCAFWGSDKCGALHLIILFIFHQTLLIHAAKPYQHVNFSNQHFCWAVYPDTTTSILKCLCYSRGIGKVQIRYFKCNIQAKKCIKVCVAG